MKCEFVFNRRKSLDQNNLASLEICVYISAKERKYYQVSKCLSKNVEEEKKKNKLKLEKWSKILDAMKILNEDMTISNFENHIENKYIPHKRSIIQEKKDSLYNSSFKDYILANVSSGRELSTQRQIEVVLEAVIRFGGMKKISDITTANIIKFNDFLAKENPKRKETTLYGYHKRLKPFINKLYQTGILKSDPYATFHPSRGRFADRKPLTQNEIDILLNATLTSTLDKVRDLFIFECFTGISFTDIKLLKFNVDVIEQDGILYVDSKRIKTGSSYFTPVLPPARKIWEKYNYHLPDISLQNQNLYLHALRERLGIRTPLTTHVARHTFATTITLAHNVPITTVAKMLGHQDIKTTQIYAKVLRNTVEDNTKDLIKDLEKDIK